MPRGIYPHKRIPIAIRFAKKWRPGRRAWKDGRVCHVWTGSLDGHGYGQMSDAKSIVRLAHRISWELMKGAIPRGKRVLHKCDNTKCVNAHHLFLGTQKDNMRDMSAKGRTGAVRHPERYPRGQMHAAAKVSAQGVVLIRQRLKRGESVSSVARSYRMSRKNIRSIRDRKTWRHVK